MGYNDLTSGFRTSPVGGIAAPPFTMPHYSFASSLTVSGALRKSPGRYYLEEFFAQTPGVNGDLASATEATRVPRNRDFEVLGTNATSALVTFSTTEGGITLTTAGADNDQMIITPHLDTKQTAWANVKWGTENQVYFDTAIRTGASIATELVWVGLKLTNTPVIATDNDQVFFRYSTDDSDANWQVVYSIGGTDTQVDSGVAVEASTIYNFRIEIDSDRKAHFFINEVEVATSTALTNDVDLIPYVGLQALDAAAVNVSLCYEKISRVLFE